MSSVLDWISKFDYSVEPSHPRKSSVICTIGPKINSVESMTQLRDAGMNVIRLDFSMGSHEYFASVIANLRKSQELRPGRPVAIALDTKGPEVCTGSMTNDIEVPITTGHEMIFTTRDEYKESGNAERYYLDYKNITKVIEVGRTINVDFGKLSFEVLEIMGDELKVRALNSGILTSHKLVNLPGTNVDLPALSEKDLTDLKFGIEQGVDMIFASFTRTGQDVRDTRKALGEAGKRIMVVGKIENHQGVINFDEILKESDAVMVARGDLGLEIPPERVFIAQKSMITKANIAGKPMICATQMLDSMTFNPRPTRAEVSDVANAILDGSDCVMLCGETLKGIYSVEATSMMSRVTHLAESVIAYDSLFNNLRALAPSSSNICEATCSAAVTASFQEKVAAILVLTTGGESARCVARYRPRVPIITISRDAQVSRQVNLYRGCYPFTYPHPKPVANDHDAGEVWQSDVEVRAQWGIQSAIEAGLLNKGDAIICLQGWRGGKGNTNTMRIIYA